MTEGNNVISFDSFAKKNNTEKEMVEFLGMMIEKPKTRRDYLALCKMHLEVFCYEEVMCSILDQEYYERAEPQIRKIVDAYYSFMTG